jgi:hypothetical protein
MNTIEISPCSRPFVVTFVCGSPPETFASVSKNEHLTYYTGRRKSKRAGMMVCILAVSLGGGPGGGEEPVPTKGPMAWVFKGIKTL